MPVDPRHQETVPSLDWPAVGSEELEWVSQLTAGDASRRMRSRHSGPYRAAVVPFISDRVLWLPSEIVALTEEASAEVARFDAELGAEVAPFASVLLRSESASSSMIENLSSGAKAIALEELLGDQGRSNAAEIVGNVRAMQAALDLSDRLDARAILAMHAALMEQHDPAIAGQWRSQPVWVGGSPLGPHGAMFVPPRFESVGGLIEDLVQFSRRQDLPVLVQASIAHAQFETIHPFPDGNGRTGRALIHALLRGHGLTRNVTVPVSAGLLADTTGYFATLDAYRDGNPCPIMAKVAEAAFAAIANGRRLVADLRQIRAGWGQEVRARPDSAVWRVADLLLRQPVINTSLIATELGLRADTAARPLDTLTQAGVLVEATGRGRNRIWHAREVLDALDAFAERAGRRG